MKRWLRFVWRTIIGGVLFLGPLLLLLIIVVQGVRLIAKILNPVASHIPIPPMLGMAVPEIAAALLLILIPVATVIPALAALAIATVLLALLVVREHANYDERRDELRARNTMTEAEAELIAGEEQE